jgi:predicted transcriptional regulator
MYCLIFTGVRLVSVSELFCALADDKSLSLFRAIATKPGSTEDFSERLKLSHKEYYSRMSKFLKAGIIKRKNATYFTTTFGKVVFDAEEIVRKAAENLWKLKALDSIDFTDDISLNERTKLLESLLDDLDIREILSNSFLKAHGVPK